MRTLAMTMAMAALLHSAAAWAGEGLVLSSSALPPEVRRTLAAEIAEAKAAQPQAFETMAALYGKMNALDQKKRGRLAALSPYLRAMGPEALWPALELLAFEAPPMPLTPSAALSLRLGLIEAVGRLREPKAAPVWVALLNSQQPESAVYRSAAQALGFLGTDEAAAQLLASSREGGPRGAAVRAGMGSCRRLVVAQALAGALARTGDEAEAAALAKALGEVANAWAWKTPAVAAKDEEPQVRATAAKALVKAYLRFPGFARQAASNALMVVDAPITGALIDQARSGASEEELASLQALAARWEKNPTR
ncbi:MAG: HEAT repeat domain-containing protein [Myxococcota bacterium]